MVRVRAYRSEDWSDLCRIHDSARLDELRYTVGTDAFKTLEQTAQEEGLFDGAVLVAERHGQVLGFVAFMPNEITWLYVDPGNYRSGLASALIEVVLAETTGDLSVEMLEGNAAALAFYQKFGFTVTARKEGNLVGNESFQTVGLTLQLFRAGTVA